MTVNPPPRPAQQNATAPWSGTDNLAFSAVRLLETSGYAALRMLRCEILGTMLIVRGFVPSFYLKQMAQTILQRLDGVAGVMNLVEVKGNEPAPGVEPATATTEVSGKRSAQSSAATS